MQQLKQLSVAHPKCTLAVHPHFGSRRNDASGRTSAAGEQLLPISCSGLQSLILTGPGAKKPFSVPALGPLPYQPAFFLPILGQMNTSLKKECQGRGGG